jgi:hypothetical protein
MSTELALNEEPTVQFRLRPEPSPRHRDRRLGCWDSRRRGPQRSPFPALRAVDRWHIVVDPGHPLEGAPGLLSPTEFCGSGSDEHHGSGNWMRRATHGLALFYAARARYREGPQAGTEVAPPQMIELCCPIEEANMHPDVLRDRTPGRSALSRDLSLDTWRTDALRCLLSDSGRYPHCPKCGRAMLAETAEQFCCPDAHATITMPLQSRSGILRRLLRMITGQPPGHSGV